SAPAVLFTFPSRYCFTIGRQGVFSLGRWSCLLPAGFLVSRGTRDPSRRELLFGYRAFTSCGGTFQSSSPKKLFCHSIWDVPQPRRACPPVWAPPRSLAATDGITVVFFSSRYLDVSVPWVCLRCSYGFTAG